MIVKRSNPRLKDYTSTLVSLNTRKGALIK